MVSSRSRRPSSPERSRKKSSVSLGRERSAQHRAGGDPLVGQPEGGRRQAGEGGQLVGDAGGRGPGQRALGRDDRQGVEQLQREGLGRVDERLLGRPALPGDLVERRGDRLRLGGALGQQPEVGGQQEQRREQRPQRRVPHAGPGQLDVGRPRGRAGRLQRGVLGPDADQRHPAAGRLVGRRDGVGARAGPGRDDGDVAGAGPHRQRRARDDVHGDRAGRAEQRAQHRGGDGALPAGHDDQPPRAAAVGDPAEPGLLGQPRRLAHLGAGAGDRREQAARVAGTQHLEVVEDLLGELGTVMACSVTRCRASSSSSTGIPSRTGKARSQVVQSSSLFSSSTVSGL